MDFFSLGVSAGIGGEWEAWPLRYILVRDIFI